MTDDSLKEEIERYLGGCGCLWTIKPVYVDDILKIFEKRIDEMIKEESQGSLYHMTSDSVLTLKQVKEMIKAEMAPEHLK